MSFFASFKKLVGINDVYDNHTTKDHFNVSINDRHGPLPDPSCISYDAHNSLLAVGSATGGLVKIYGRPGAELTLKSANRGAPITSVTLVPETGHVLVASTNVLEVINLGSGNVQATLSFDAAITCVSYYFSCSFVYVGLGSGEVSIVNLDGWTKSLYRIAASQVELPPGSKDRSVVSVAINPERDDIILLGFACGAINEWEIKTSKVLRRYFSDKPLRCVTWDPSGNRMLAGHANGELVTWTRKKSIADEIYYPMANITKPSPIKRLFWFGSKSSSGESSTVTLGGTDFPNGIVIDQLKQKKRTFIPLARPGVELRDACMLYETAPSSSAATTSSAPEPVGVIAVDAQGHLHVHALNAEVDEKAMLPTVNPPLPFSLSGVSVLSSMVISEPMYLLQDLVATGNIDPSDAMKGQTSNMSWPLKGGSFAIDPNTTPVIMMTLMSNNTIIFWDLSMRNCRVPIYRIRLPGVLTTQSNLTFDFCPHSRVLHVGNAHEVFIYHFSLESRSIDLMTIDDSINATASPIKHETESSSSHSTPSTPTPPQQIPAEEPTSTKEEPPRSVVLDEAAPTPPPILERAPSSVSEPLPQSPSTPVKSQQSATNLKLSKSGNSTASLSSSGGSTPGVASGTPAPSSPNPTASPSTSSALLQGIAPANAALQKRVVYSPMPAQAPGFQFVGSLSLEGKSIQCLKFESGLQLLAASTQDGKVHVFDTSNNYSKRFTYTPPANTLPCPPIVTHLQFCESLLENLEEHLLLIMGLDLGSVQTISLTHPSRAFKPISARKSPVSDIHLVRHRGDPFSLHKRSWTKTPPTAEILVHKPSHSVPKHLIVCTVNDIRAYKLPELEMVSSYDCPAPIAWYGTIQVNVEIQGKHEPEYVLAAIDMGSNVLFVRLMNLTLVSYTGPNNLTKMGVQGVSPMSTSRSCNLLNGTVILHTDTIESYIIKLLPYQETRPTSKLLGPDPPKPLTKRSKGLKGLIGKDKDVNFEEVFGPRKDQPVATTSSTAGTPKAPPKPVSASASNAQSQMNDTKSVMSENMDRLKQRGDKLSDLAEQSAQVAEASRSFASLARQLSEQQKKSWF